MDPQELKIKARLSINLKKPRMSCSTKSLYCWEGGRREGGRGGGADGDRVFDSFFFFLSLLVSGVLVEGAGEVIAQAFSPPSHGSSLL